MRLFVLRFTFFTFISATTKNVCVVERLLLRRRHCACDPRSLQPAKGERVANATPQAQPLTKQSNFNLFAVSKTSL